MMKKQLFLFAVILCLCSCKKEKIAIAGSGWQEIAIIDKKTGIIEWKHALENGDECNNIEVTPKGNVLYAYSKGAKLINRKHETIWDFKAKENEEIHSAIQIDGEGFIIAVCGEPAKLVELDKNGNTIKEIPFETLTFNINKQFRQISRTESGVYLIPLIEKRKILQISPEGRNKGSLFIGNDIFSAKALKNNNIIVSCGSDGNFLEINPLAPHRDSIIVTNSIKGGSLLYVAEIIPLDNGNKLVANSNMYSNNKSQPLLVELNTNDEIIWSLPFNKEIKNITAIYSFFE